MKTTKSKQLLVCGILLSVLLISVSLVAMHLLHGRMNANETRNELLTELMERDGEYDTQSIVLADTTRSKAESLAKKYNAKLRITSNGSFATLTLPQGVTILDVVSDESCLEDIDEMSIDYHAYISEIEEDTGTVASERVPSRPQYNVKDASFYRQTYLDYINMQSVWKTTRGSGVTVAVIDTGIDTDHPEFQGRISEYSYNASEDKVVKNTILSDGSMDWSLIEDEDGHGTAVTGVIAADLNAGEIVGIAPQVKILVIKAEVDENGQYKRTSDLVFGLYYAIECNVHVVNMSFGGPGANNPYAEATQLAVDSDIICVASAGNDATSTLYYPAADKNVFGIGALAEDSWELAEYSNFGENVDFVAPGTTYTTKMNGGYGYSTGTSLSAPIVTGAIALNINRGWHMEFAEMEELLRASSHDLGDLGPDIYYGYGALDINALVIEERGTVTFNMLTDELENTTQLFISNHTLQDMPEPERLYAVFDGWYYDPHYQDEYACYEDKFVTDLTLYAKWINEEDGLPYIYVELEDGTIEIRSYTGRRKYITIPDYIDGKKVTSIGNGAFKNESDLREVVLPQFLEKIGASAFAGCSDLREIQIPDTVKVIGSSGFEDNIRLSVISFGANSELSTIGDFAFSGCSKLKYFQISKKVIAVNGSSFAGATSLERFSVQKGNNRFTAKDGVLFDISVTTLVCAPAKLEENYQMPKTIRNIGSYAFAYSDIKTLDLTGVSNIGEFAFEYSDLEKISLPDSLVSMGKRAFLRNAYLKEVSLGNGITMIPEEAFIACTSLRRIEISSQIRLIDKSAFEGASLSEGVYFAKNSELFAIDTEAFSGCGFSSIRLPASLSIIGGGAFSSSNALTEVLFENESNLRIIGQKAFNLTSLSSISLPDALETIDDLAFAYTKMTEIAIPKNVSELGYNPFANCYWLQQIEVAEENDYYCDVSNVLYNKEKTSLITYPAGLAQTSYSLENETKVIAQYAFAGVPNLYNVKLSMGLQEIGEYAFHYATNLRSLTLPDSLVIINRYAFNGCDSLFSISFGKNSSMERIGNYAFSNCAIRQIEIPANISMIAQGTFSGCKYLSQISFAAGSKLESISSYMFDGCPNLTAINFGEGSSLEHIQAHGFEGLTRLNTLDLSGTKLKIINNFAFRFCKNLSDITLPGTVESIGRYAFYECEKLHTLFLPESITSIGRYAFWGTDELEVYFQFDQLPLTLQENWDHGIKAYYLGVTDVVEDGDFRYAVLSNGGRGILEYRGYAQSLDLSKVSLGGPILNIGGSAFEGTSVSSIVLPQTLAIIQANAFKDSALQQITIPSSVTFIGRSAFEGTPLQSVVFEDHSKLTVIEQSAFERTKNLLSIDIPSSVTTIGRAIFKQSGLRSVVFEKGIQLTQIPEEAFAYTALESIVLPDDITLIDHNAFRETRALCDIDFGESDELRIMSNAFYQAGLQSLEIPAHVSYIGEYAFVGLSDLKAFVISEQNQFYDVQDGVLISEDGRKLITVPAGKEGSFTVPKGIEEIGFGAFEESKLSEIHFLPDANILSFGCRAFFGANHITELYVPDSVVAIDYYAFAYCENLQKVVFADANVLQGVYEGAFCGCSSLNEISLPSTVKEIGKFAFYDCDRLDEMPVGDDTTITIIGDYAMAYTNLQGDLVLPMTLTDIGDYAFMGTKIRKAVVHSDHVDEFRMGLGVFEECDELEEITLPFIGAYLNDTKHTWFGYVFGADSYHTNNIYVPGSLKTVNLGEGMTFIGPYAFSQCSSLEHIEMPHSIELLCGRAFEGTTATYEFTNYMTPAEINHKGKLVAKKDFGWSDFSEGISGCFRVSEYVETLSFNHAAWPVDEVELSANIKNLTLYPDIKNIYYAGTLSDWMKIEHSCTQRNNGTNLYLQGELLQDSVVIPADVNKIGDYALANLNITEVTFHDNITELGEFAFAYCRKLKHVVLPENVTKIGSYAFRGCTSLMTVYIPDRVTEIGSNAFAYCSELISARLSQNITKLNEYTFEWCTSLENIVIPDKVTDIDRNAFNRCTSLRNITIGSSVKNIANVFNNCGAIEYIVNRSDLPIQLGSTAYDGIAQYAKSLTDKNGNTTYVGDETHIEYMETSDGFCFYKTTEDEHYVLYAYVGDQEVVTLPLKVNGESYDIKKVSGVKHLMIPDGMQKIPDSAFEGCETLITVQMTDSVLDIGISAFEDCINLESIRLSEKLTIIDHHTFYKCTSLKSIELPLTVTAIGFRAFGYCFSLKELDLHEGIVDLGGAFGGCEGLTSVKLPESVKNIEGAFSNCINLTDIYIGSNVEHVRGAFENCTSLKSVILPKGLTAIGSKMFYGCESLANVLIPDSVTAIEADAFSNCKNLRELLIPKATVSIQSSAFQGCSFAKISIHPENPEFWIKDGVVYSKDRTKILFALPDVKHVVVPAIVTSVAIVGHPSLETVAFEEGSQIQSISFEECTQLRRVVLPETMTTINNSAFSNCLNLEEIVIPDSVMTIDNDAFYKCRKLVNIDLPSKLNYLGRYAFFGCIALEEIVIPETITKIEDSTFSQCTNLKRVVLPNFLTEIGDSAFSNCDFLTEIHLPEGLEVINDSVFAGCKNLKKMVLPSTLTYWGDRVFGDIKLDILENKSDVQVNADGCVVIDKNGNILYDEKYEMLENENGKFLFEKGSSYNSLVFYFGTQDPVVLPTDFNGKNYRVALKNIESVIIPETMTIVPGYMFYNAGNLKSIQLHDDIAEIGPRAFLGCSNLETIMIPDGITKIEDCAFTGCSKLKIVTIPDSVTVIEYNAFEKCTSLIQIDIPKSVTLIEGEAFAGCKNLSMIHLPENVNLWPSSFADTAYQNDPDNWIDGALYLDNYLLQVDDETVSLEVLSNVEYIAEGVLSQCYNLKSLKINPNVWRKLSGFDKLETLWLTETPDTNFYWNLPNTIENIVLGKGIKMNAEMFSKLSNATIYVEDLEEDVRWDANYPGWSNGNHVVYGDDWIAVKFFDHNDNLMTNEIFLTSQVVRRPYYKTTEDDMYVYTLIGWDLNGDGLADPISATSLIDITAKAVVSKELRTFTVRFYDKDDETVLYSYELPYGSTLVLPEKAPERFGYTFKGWRLPEDMSITQNLDVYSVWEHVGGTHVYGEPQYFAPTCTKYGYVGYTCSVCGEIEEIRLEDTLPHIHVMDHMSPASCSQEGYIVYRCVCGDVYTETLPMLEHNYGAWSVSVQTTCEGEGCRSRMCLRCHATEQETISALGHDYFVKETLQSATCMQEGVLLYSCSRCKQELLVSTWIADHVYQQIEISDALRHLILEKMPSVYVQYDGDHTYVYECEACGKIQNASISQSGGTAGTASAACVHTHTTQEILQQATCRDTGLIASVCEKCDQIVELKTMGKTTHSMADGWYADHENHWHECTVCHEKTDLAVHTYPADSDCCSVCEKEKYILGDMNGDSIVNSSDAIYLLRHTIMPTLYPIAQPVDVNGDGTVNSADAIYLLRHTIMPQLYPLVKK